MKTLVVGDIHGCLDELLNLLDQARPDLTAGRLVLLGDYIDRGPRSYEVVQHLRGLRDKYGPDHVVMLRGNHEQMAIDFREHGDRLWHYNGSRSTRMSLEANGASLGELVRFFKTLPLYYQDEHFIYVHAGLRPGVKLDRQSEYDLLWIREGFYARSWDFGKRVVFGHTPVSYIGGGDDPIIWPHMIALDTGCVNGGALSALEIEDDRIIHIHKVPSGIKRRRTRFFKIFND
ncbi:MAG: metallophosphoesterase family protein [Syntrophomonadaceae bacterium]